MIYSHHSFNQELYLLIKILDLQFVVVWDKGVYTLCLAFAYRKETAFIGYLKRQL